MKAYKKYSKNKKFCKTEEKAKKIFCLPLYPELTKEDVMKICKQVNNCLNKYHI